MFVFECVGCGAELTAALSQVALPIHAHQSYGNGIQLPVLMGPGTFAVDPEPSGPPWRRWEEIPPDEAEARGVYAPVSSLSDGTPGAVVIAPGDVRGTVLLPEKRGGACCGLAGGDGPNMTCEACGLLVATRIDDCSLWQAVWLAPEAVRRVPVGGGDTVNPLLSWAELTETVDATPPFEPIAGWGQRLGFNYSWSWSPQWEAAAGQALAHLLVASEGRPVTVPDKMASDVFQRSLDALLPAGPQARHAVLAGPERPGTDGDILFVPTHPQTGDLWAPDSRTASRYRVPLPFGVWLWLAFPPYGGMPDAPLPHFPFRVDPDTFRHTLVRLPAVRSPWLREIHENLAHHRRAGLF